MKKVLATLFVLGAAYLFTPSAAMADGITFRIGLGFPAPARREYLVERPHREVIVEHPYWHRDEFARRDWDRDRGYDHERRDHEDRQR